MVHGRVRAAGRPWLGVASGGAKIPPGDSNVDALSSAPSASTFRTSRLTTAASSTAGNRMPVSVGSACTWREANRVSSTGVARRSTSALTSRWATRRKTRETSKLEDGEGGSLGCTMSPASRSRLRHSRLACTADGCYPTEAEPDLLPHGPFRSSWGVSGRQGECTSRVARQDRFRYSPTMSRPPYR
jgi:hypothetical protein